MRRPILYTFLCLVLVSCRDHLKIEANNLPQGYADSQVVGYWKITAVVSNIAYDWDNNGVAETDVYNTWSDCKKDNLYHFVGDKTGTYRINCNDTRNGTWRIFDTQELTYTPDSLATEVERIIAMTSNEFKTRSSLIIPGGPTVLLTRTWTRQ